MCEIRPFTECNIENFYFNNKTRSISIYVIFNDVIKTKKYFITLHDFFLT